MTLYLFLGIPAKYNLPVENFHPYGVQSSKVKEGRSVFPMQQNLSKIVMQISEAKKLETEVNSGYFDISNLSSLMSIIVHELE